MLKDVRLPSNIDQLIAEIKTEGPGEWMPGETGYARNGEVDLCYETIGEAKKGNVLLISGHSQTMLAYPKHFYQPLVDAGYRIIRMDNRGVGQSSWMNSWSRKNTYTLSDMAADVIAIFDNLEIKKAHIVGMSMGGMIGQTLAIEHPERVQSLTSIMSTGYYYDPELQGEPEPFKQRMVSVTVLYGQDLTTLENKLKIHLAINRLLKGKGEANFPDKLVLQKAFYENTKRNGYSTTAFMQHGYAIKKSGSRYEGLKQLSVPTLVIHGTDDTLVLVEHSEKYAQMIPNAKTLFLEGMGHHLPEEYTPQMQEAMLDLFEVANMKEESIA